MAPSDFFPLQEDYRSDLAGKLSNPQLEIVIERWKTAFVAAKTAERPIPILEIIDAKTTAVLVVDMQRAFLDEGAAIEIASGRNIIQKINLITARFRLAGAKIVFMRYLVDERVGMLRYFEAKSYLSRDRESPLVALRAEHPHFQIHPELKVHIEDAIIDKVRYSAVLGSGLVSLLRSWRVTNVVITGVTTDVCAGNTAEDLMQEDFHVVVVSDGTAALSRLEHELTLARLFGLYADVMPTHQLISRVVVTETTL